MEIPSGGGNTSIIQRVLNLRKKMGIDNELSTADPRDAIFFPSQMETSKDPVNVPSIHDRRRWLAWPKIDDDDSTDKV